MKKIFFIVFLAAILLLVYSLRKDNSIVIDDFAPSLTVPQDNGEYLFVPYWTFANEINSEDKDLIYFGVSIDENGIDRDEPGYSLLPNFLDQAGDSNKYLTLRIIGNDALKIIDNINLQKQIGRETAELAKDNGFKGVVVDFETSAFGFSSTEGKITELYRNLHREIKKENLEFAVTVFGDNYYRARPYNIKAISELSDKVIIMAYDFHKARLNPGANFPFSGREKYGYDFQMMIEDFKKDVDFEKIVVALGYFGYDWKLEDGVSVEIAEPLSLNQINSRFIDDCRFDNCKRERNTDLESVVTYTDDEGFSHEVWFESIESAEKKIEFLNKMGINQVAFWAYSYY